MMSLTKLLLAPIKLFRKEVITFVIVRRFDLRIINENLQYIAVKPSASISVLRQKVWHLLDLPDYCEEIIILKSPGEVEIPLTELRRGNDPQHPYYLEVWLPKPTIPNTMLTYKNCGDSVTTTSANNDNKESFDKLCNASQTTFLTETMTFNQLRGPKDKSDNKYAMLAGITCKQTKSSLFKISGKKSQDNFTNLLLKIQNDLSTLSVKLSVLENGTEPFVCESDSYLADFLKVYSGEYAFKKPAKMIKLYAGLYGQEEVHDKIITHLFQFS